MEALDLVSSAMDKPSVDSFLSEDFVFKEILPKVTAKSLMRFKAVAKSWLALISTDSTFAANHLHHHHPNAAVFSHITRARYSHEEKGITRFFFLGRDTSKLVEIDTSYITKTLSSSSQVTCVVRLLGSVNGLVYLRLLYSDKSSALVLWNPVTREFKNLPAPILPSLPRFCSCCENQLDKYYIGFDKESNDYKIVRLEEYETQGEDEDDDDDDDDDDDGIEYSVDVQLFTKSSGRWRQLKGFRGFELLFGRGLGFVVDGAMHWSILRGGKTPAKSSLFGVLSFDVHSEELREWDGPVCPDDEEYDHLELIKWKGSLGALMVNPGVKECQFWLRTENKWTKMLNVEPNIPSWSFGGVLRDQVLVLDRKKQKEYLYDVVSKEITELEDDLGRVFFYEVFDYLPSSLVSPYY